ncbi:MAG: Nuclear envelope morphology protein 1 [Geoglossum umbratile]|nr:MAG: Nuclear envelope morphology protein 1 [Geoglossum umbratile]
MNSLNILSARVIGSTPPQTPPQSRTHSYGDLAKVSSQPAPQSRRASKENVRAGLAESSSEKEIPLDANVGEEEDDDDVEEDLVRVDEKTALLNEQNISGLEDVKLKGWRYLTKRVADAFIASLRWVLSTLAAPGVYLVSFLYDDRGHFAPMWPVRSLSQILPHRGGRASTTQAMGISVAPAQEDSLSQGQLVRHPLRRQSFLSPTRPGTSGSTSSVITSDSELDESYGSPSSESTEPEGPSHHTRSKSVSLPTEDAVPARRSIRIKLYNEGSTKHRKNQKSRPGASPSSSSASSDPRPAISVATLKSPTSSASSLRRTKYPRTPTPPRPLIPRLQPSSAYPDPTAFRIGQKTLILDLDETLIHSLAKGGRMGTGHMVEVKLNTPVGIGGGTVIGPQHPILYYVHKRPHCDDFLRKVCKWYNLVVFTASVQEYADPVIDWLEQDRKFFRGRYYRQHCTYRNGAYIKDISSIEPDLSKVMIVDNSPMSYIFHEDNAIPIEGWINDPTDNDLLHLIPLLEALQYATDVRALLALRMGESVAV